MNDVSTKSEVNLFSDDELSCKELDAVSGGKVHQQESRVIVKNW